MTFLSSVRSFGKSIVSRLAAAYAFAREAFGALASPFDVADYAAPSRTVAASRAPGYGQVPTPMKRSRSLGKARPSGSKLARKAAKGTIGLTH